MAALGDSDDDSSGEFPNLEKSERRVGHDVIEKKALTSRERAHSLSHPCLRAPSLPCAWHTSTRAQSTRAQSTLDTHAARACVAAAHVLRSAVTSPLLLRALRQTRDDERDDDRDETDEREARQRDERVRASRVVGSHAPNRTRKHATKRVS